MPSDKSALVFYVNGKKVVDYDVDPEDNLLTYLRRKLCLTGCKYGCGEGACGACTVMVSQFNRKQQKIENFAVTSCLFPICSVHGKAVTTVEGIGTSKKPHPVQERLSKSHGSQCGFCTPGMIMSMYAALRNNPKITAGEIEKALHCNLCRCTGYRPILEGFRSFTEESCGKDKCCKKNTCNDTGNQEFTSVLTRKHEFSAYNPSQDPIFPPELQLSNSLDVETIQFNGPRVTWIAPVTLKELLNLKDKHPEAPVLFGNTYLRVSKQNLHQANEIIIAPRWIEELHTVKVEKTSLSVGGAVTVSQLQNHLLETAKTISESQKRSMVAIYEHLNYFAGQQIRNMVALGSNVVQPFSASDVNVLLVAAEATADITGQSSNRSETVWNLITDPKTKLKPNEILTTIHIPFTQDNEYFFSFKQTLRTFADTPIVNAGLKVKFEASSDVVHSVVICFGSIGQTTILARNTMDFLKQKNWSKLDITELTKKLQEDIEKFGDKATMNAYKRALACSLMFKLYLSVTEALHKDQPDVIKQMPSQQEMSAIKSTPSTYESTYTFLKVPADQCDKDTIGRPRMHSSGLAQATGQAVYCDDIPPINGQLYMGLVISQRAHANIKSVDPSSGLNLPGVISYIDHKNVVDNMTGIMVPDETVFAVEKVLYKGHLIGVIIAEDQQVARRAAALVKVEYEDLKPVFTIEDAIKANSILLPLGELKKGDIEVGFKESEIILEGEVRSGHQKHFYLEPMAVTAIPSKEHEELEIFITTQDPYTTQRLVSKALGIPFNRIAVKVKRVGGSYGGKISQNNVIGIPAAVAAYTLNRPVRYTMTREEDMVMLGGRTPVLFKYKVGFSKTGRIRALQADLYLNSGYSIDVKPFLAAFIITRMTGPYSVPHILYKHHVMKTNLPTTTALRGFGTPQALFFIENVMNAIGIKLNLPQEKIREINFLREGEPNSHNQIISPNPIIDCWYECLEKSDYHNKKMEIAEFNRNNRWKKRGIAIEALHFGIENNHFPMNYASAMVHINMDGSVLITHGSVEIGQGIHTRIIQIASKELKISSSKIHIVETATDKVPNGHFTAGSGSTDCTGYALVDACAILMERLKPIMDEMPDATWSQWIMKAYTSRIDLAACGFWKNPEPEFHSENFQGDFSSYYAFGATCCEVEIDCLTGSHEFLKCHMVYDLGKSLNPAIDIGQLEGAFIQGCGLFTMENWTYDSTTGNVLTIGPRTYRIPTVGDIPSKFHIYFLKGTENPKGIYSSRAVGELSSSFGICLYLAIKDAVFAARAESGLEGDFKLEIPATVEKIRLACADHFCSNSEKITRL